MQCTRLGRAGIIDAMSRTERLFDLITELRRHRVPISAASLAEKLQVSVRTIYRDIATLVALGAPVEGEAGVGYLLRPGFFLPPLSFSAEELEALVLGARWVRRQHDAGLADAAGTALAKIAAAAPNDLRDAIDGVGVWVAPSCAEPASTRVQETLREAIRTERKVEMVYRREGAEPVSRVVWPLVIAYFDHARVMAAWCELRADFRNFRTDRVLEARMLDAPFPTRRRALLDRYVDSMGYRE